MPNQQAILVNAALVRNPCTDDHYVVWGTIGGNKFREEVLFGTPCVADEFDALVHVLRRKWREMSE
jgi:hypothetical protein